MSLEDRRSFHRRSIDHPEDFWAEQARAIDWRKGWETVLDLSDAPRAKWFAGGETNLCHNAVDRHLRERGDQNALIYVSTETGEEREYTYRELHREVNAFAAALRGLGVNLGDRVVLYMPMMVEAIFAMLACARLGAIHSFVFRGCPAAYLANRIGDAQPEVIVTADTDMSGGRVIPCKKLVDEALDAAQFSSVHTIVCRRGIGASPSMIEGRDFDYAELREKYMGAEIPIEWVESGHPSHILHTSGASGPPRLVERDTGGYAVALAASMKHIFDSEPGETMFTASGASDMGWVVGHSYIAYAPLLHGMSSVVYEGLPTRPDPGIWWRIVERHGVNTMLTSPTAIRALKEHGYEHMSKFDASSLRNFFLAGEPLCGEMSRRISEALGVAVRDTYWQTETGWPILSSPPPSLGDEQAKEAAPSTGLPCHGYDLRITNPETGEEVREGEGGMLAIASPLPSGFASLAPGDERFEETCFSDLPESLYSTTDWARRVGEGRYLVLGRSDDVIEASGQRFGTREIEEAICALDAIEEAAAVSVADGLGERLAHVVYVVLGEGAGAASELPRASLEDEIKAVVRRKVGQAARPDSVRFATSLPRTRSGKMLHRCIRAIAGGREVGDVSTIKNPDSLKAVRAASPATVREREKVIEYRGGKL